MAHTISRGGYAAMFGPTTGDRLRLADTELVIEIEADHTVYGEEVKFGGGKVIRDGMGQSQRSRAEGAVDTVITNAVILDHWGVIKADIGIRDGFITHIGKAGNPDVQPGVDIVIGPGTEVNAGACGLKLHEDWGTTPAAIDCCMSVADELDVQVTLHTDTLNESGFVESTISAFKGRTVHAFHTEGAGGGHAPDIIRVCGLP